MRRFAVPLVVNRNINKWKPFYLNLNALITVSRFPPQRNQIKKNYKKLIDPILDEIEPIKGPLKIIYTIYAKNRSKFDIGNVGSVVDKFLCDALVDKGILEEDNIDVIKSVEFVFGGVDKDNPRAEVEILKLQEAT